MTNSVTPTSGSPFDALRREDEQGEYWSARDLIRPLGYDRWQTFEDVIERARASAGNTGVNVAVEFMQVTQLTNARNLGSQERRDYRLTRHAAYLVVMNGDPRKREIADAQEYFAVKTREAETMSAPSLRNPALQQVVTLAIQMQQTQDEQERLARVQQEQATEIAALAEDVSTLRTLSPITASGAYLTLRDVAHSCDTGQNRLSKWLGEKGVRFRDHQGKWRVKQEWMESGWAKEEWEQAQNGVGWFWVTYFTPAGQAQIMRMWRAAHPS